MYSIKFIPLSVGFQLSSSFTKVGFTCHFSHCSYLLFQHHSIIHCIFIASTCPHVFGSGLLVVFLFFKFLQQAQASFFCCFFPYILNIFFLIAIPEVHQRIKNCSSYKV